MAYVFSSITLLSAVLWTLIFPLENLMSLYFLYLFTHLKFISYLVLNFRVDEKDIESTKKKKVSEVKKKETGKSKVGPQTGTRCEADRRMQSLGHCPSCRF